MKPKRYLLATVSFFYELLEPRLGLGNVRIEVLNINWFKNHGPRKYHPWFDLKRSRFSLEGAERQRFEYKLYENVILRQEKLKNILSKKRFRITDFYPIVGIFTRFLILQENYPQLNTPIKGEIISQLNHFDLLWEAAYVYHQWLQMRRKGKMIAEWNWSSLD